jgi:predicted ribosome quality control (RQC) complex YloA/Tae2 family protein
MKFGAGDNEVHLIVEFYAAGNIILTDKDYKITALLRSYSLEDGTSVGMNEKYPIEKIGNIPQVSEESIKTSVTAPEAANVAMKELMMKVTSTSNLTLHP